MADFEKTASALKRLYEKDPGTGLVVSNQVIGEAYITLQHFYKISKKDARSAILSLFASTGISPRNGEPVISLLKEEGGAGLLDRLIAQDYGREGVDVLTNDKRMAKLEGVVLLD